jgi:hypothetical protein
MAYYTKISYKMNFRRVSATVRPGGPDAGSRKKHRRRKSPKQSGETGLPVAKTRSLWYP